MGRALNTRTLLHFVTSRNLSSCVPCAVSAPYLGGFVFVDHLHLAGQRMHKHLGGGGGRCCCFCLFDSHFAFAPANTSGNHCGRVCVSVCLCLRASMDRKQKGGRKHVVLCLYLRPVARVQQDSAFVLTIQVLHSRREIEAGVVQIQLSLAAQMQTGMASWEQRESWREKEREGKGVRGERG